MLINTLICDDLDMRGYSSLPRLGSGVIRRYKAGSVELVVEKNPVSNSGEDIVYIPYSVIALIDGTAKAVVSLEKTDLRALSFSLGTSLRDLQKEYNTRGVFSEGEVYAYGEDKRESYGLYPDEDNEETIILYLLNVMLDIIDSGDDLTLIS